MKILLAISLLISSNLCVGAVVYVEDDRETDKVAHRASKYELAEKWKYSKPRSYYYILSSKGWANYFPLVTVYVVDGEVTRVINIHPLMNVDMEPKLSDFGTIDELIDLAESAEKKENEYFEPKYNLSHGYPEIIKFWPKGVHHGDKEFNILGFGAIKEESNKAQKIDTNEPKAGAN